MRLAIRVRLRHLGWLVLVAGLVCGGLVVAIGGSPARAAAAAQIAVTGTPVSATEGSAFSGQVATFVDNGCVAGATYSATVNWGDGTPSSAGTVTPSPSPNPCTATTFTVMGAHTYADEGPFTITTTVTATGGSGSSPGTGTSTATVAEGDFGSLISVTIAPTEGQSFSGSVGSFTDPGNPGQTASDFTATINWGDGTALDTTTATVSGPTGGPFTVNGTHTYADEGTFTINSTFSDDPPSTLTNNPIQSTANVVEGDFGTLNPVTITPTEGQSFSGSVGSFTDTGNPAQPASDWSATINWGDGSALTTGTVGGPTGGPFTISGTHTYTDEGTFTITVTFSDDPPSTLTNIPIFSTANVAEGDALVGTGTTFTAQQGQSTGTIVVATFTDNGYPGNVAGDFTATINWGDGTPATVGTVTGTGPGGTAPFTVSGTHTYATSGTFTVTATLTDDAPGTDTATATSTATSAHGITSCSVNPTVLPKDGALHGVTVTIAANGPFTLQSVTSNEPIVAGTDYTFVPGTTYPAGTTSVSGSLKGTVSAGSHGRQYVLTFVPSGGVAGPSCQVTVQVRLR